MGDPHQEHLTSAGKSYATYLEGHGNDVKLYELGSDGPAGTSGALADLAAAIDAAKKFIFVCDWSFHPYMRMGPRTAPPTVALTAGAKLNARAKDGVLVAIHAWDHTGAGAPDDQNDEAGKRLDDIAKALGDKGRSANLLWRISSRSGANVGWSIHQKFVVLDAGGVVKAFFGGLDLTKGRFDWGEHPILYPGATGPLGARLKDAKGRTYDDWYSAEFQTKQTGVWLPPNEPGDPSMPRQPWQDYYAQIAGPAAWDILREFVGRWNTHAISGMSSGSSGAKDIERVEKFFLGLFSDAGLKKPWEDHGGPFTARVVRSIVKDDWGQRRQRKWNGTLGDPIPCNTPTPDGKTQTEFIWSVPKSYEDSIEQAYVNAIQNTKRFIYIESQYFIGSGPSWGRPSVTNRIPKAIVDKILGKIAQGEEFHAYIVIPMFPEGDPVGGAAPDQRLFEWATMRYMARTVAKAARDKGKDWTDFLTFYFLANWTPLTTVKKEGDRMSRVKANQRYMVYVHSKLMICDDDYLILGSANLNERSLAGNRDTEICVYIFADEGKLALARAKIQEVRQRAWREHFDGLPPSWDAPEKAACVRAMLTRGLANWIALATGKKPDKSHLVAWPFEVGQDLTSFFVKSIVNIQDQYIFDAATTSGGLSSNDWMWASPLGGSFAVPGSLAE
jgi:phospholipase D1/2